RTKAHHIERELAELLAHRFLVEHAENRILAMDGRHDGNAKIDGPIAITHAEAAILRYTALSDIEFAHHFYARDDGGVVFLGNRLHGGLEHAINTVLDGHRIIAGL